MLRLFVCVLESKRENNDILGILYGIRSFTNAMNSNEKVNNMSKKIIKFGKWENKPIEWIVLKEEGIFSLVITKTRLDGSQRRYDNTSGTKWINSDIRKFLNTVFLNKLLLLMKRKKL